MADEALLNRATLAGFQQTRYMTQKHIWSRALMTGTKFAIFSGLLSGIELGMSYYRGYWDAWNPLLAGTGAGILYALPTSTYLFIVFYLFPSPFITQRPHADSGDLTLIDRSNI